MTAHDFWSPFPTALMTKCERCGVRYGEHPAFEPATGECPPYCPHRAGGDHDHTDPFPQIVIPDGAIVEVVSPDSSFNGQIGQVLRRFVGAGGHETYFVTLFKERAPVPFGRSELRV